VSLESNSLALASPSDVSGTSLTMEAWVDSSTNPGRPTVLLTHPTGNQNVRNALLSLVEHEMLAEFWTTIAWDPESRWNALLPGRLRAELARRSFSMAPGHLVKNLPWREVVRVGLRATPLAGLVTTGERPFSTIGVYRDFDRKVARRVADLQPNIVYGYEGATLHTFRQAKMRGITTVHEQPSAYWYWRREFFSEEAGRNPEFASLLPALKDPAGHLEWKEEELRLADYVVVPSQHVRRTLAGVVPDAKILLTPYGAPEVKLRRQFNIAPSISLKVLFVGNLGHQKGIGYLLEAIDLLGSQVELTMVGRRLRSNARVDEACRRWRWYETLPHSQVMQIMQQSDVLVLPSLSDAFGLVVTEALACGLPVIVTPNTGASEMIRDGQEGFVVPVRDAEAIASRLETLHRDREMLAEMSRSANMLAAENSWEKYRDNWARALRSLVWQ
jgi:starch synthase